LKPLALTGGIACGKTTAGHFLLEAGFSHVYDTDAICHDLYEHPTPELLAGMRKDWGDEVVTSDLRIDRAALSKRLFAESNRAEAFAALNSLVHPAVERCLQELMARDAVRETELVLVEVPLLFEIGWDTKYSHTIAVWMPREMQIGRLMARNGLSREDAESRLDVQLSADAKLARADFGLINNSGLEHLRKQCFELVAQLKSTMS
jgi:dephospho-CoA kinase